MVSQDFDAHKEKLISKDHQYYLEKYGHMYTKTQKPLKIKPKEIGQDEQWKKLAEAPVIKPTV